MRYVHTVAPKLVPALRFDIVATVVITTTSTNSATDHHIIMLGPPKVVVQAYPSPRLRTYFSGHNPRPIMATAHYQWRQISQLNGARMSPVSPLMLQASLDDALHIYNTLHFK